jgi:hypothetical protein
MIGVIDIDGHNELCPYKKEDKISLNNAVFLMDRLGWRTGT